MRVRRGNLKMGAEAVAGGIAGAALTALYFLFKPKGQAPSAPGNTGGNNSTPGNVEGKLVLPPAYNMNDYTLFSDREIRDTKTYYPDELLDLSQATYWGFDVENSCNQDVICELIGGSRDIPASAGLIDVGATVTIAAGATLPIATDIWMPFLGVRISYAVAPTSGKLRTTGWVQERLF